MEYILKKLKLPSKFDHQNLGHFPKLDNIPNLWTGHESKICSN